MGYLAAKKTVGFKVLCTEFGENTRDKSVKRGAWDVVWTIVLEPRLADGNGRKGMVGANKINHTPLNELSTFL